MFPDKVCQAHYEDGVYINTFGENPEQAKARYLRQARERAQRERWLEKSVSKNSPFVIMMLYLTRLINTTLKK